MKKIKQLKKEIVSLVIIMLLYSMILVQYSDIKKLVRVIEIKQTQINFYKK